MPAGILPAAVTAATRARTWRDGINAKASYKSPKTGTVVEFDWEVVSRETPLRRAVFEFPGINDAYVQDNGFSSRVYPLACIFWGDRCDALATAFEAALIEPGVGSLNHPFYGKLNVIPMGTIVRRDDLKSAANQAIVEVSFWTTTAVVYPQSQVSPKNEIEAAALAFSLAAANQYAAATKIDKAISKANVATTVRELLKKVRGALDKVSAATASVNRQFRDIERDINFGIDVLVGQPILLARQILNLIQAPGRALLGIMSRLEGYARLAASILKTSAAVGTQQIPGIAGTSVKLASLKLKESNDFQTADLMVMSSVSGAALACLEAAFSSASEARFQTRAEAVEAAVALLAQLDAAVVWREQRYDALEEVDTGESYQALQRLVALVAGLLVETSFDLAVEKRIVLDRPRTIIDLCAELYGTVDDKLDFLINTNNLTGSEILELPRGKSIAYYV